MTLRAFRLCFAALLLFSGISVAQNERDVLFAYNRANEFKQALRYDEADKEYRRGLDMSLRVHGEDHKNTALLLNAHGELYARQSKFEEAEKIYTRNLKIVEKLKDADDLNVAIALTSLGNVSMELGKYEVSEKLLKRALEIREKASGEEENTDVGDSLNDLAVLASRQGKNEEAERLYRRSLIIRQKTEGPDSLVVAQSLSNLGLTLHELDRHKDAEDCHRRALEIREKVKGPDHPTTADSLNNLGILLRDVGRYQDAELAHRRALSIRETALGTEHLRTTSSASNLAVVCADQGKFAEAAGWFLRALGTYERTFGPDHPTVSDTLGSLGLLEKARGRPTDAEKFLIRSLATAEKVYGPTHQSIVPKVNNLAAFQMERGKFAEAETLYRRSLGIHEKAMGSDHPAVSASLTDLANLCVERGQPKDAQVFLERSLKIREKAYGSEHPSVVDAVNSLAVAANKAGDFKSAEALYRRNVVLMEKLFGPVHVAFAETVFSLAGLHTSVGRYAEAEAGYLQVLAIFEKALGTTHPNVANTLTLLGTTLRNQGKLSAAREMHQRARDMSQKIFGIDHPTVSVNVNHLATDAWMDGKHKDAATLFDEHRRSARRYLMRDLPYLPEAEQREFILQSEVETFARALTLGRDKATEPDMARRSAEWLLNGKAAAVESRTLRSRLERDITDPEARKALAEVQDLRSREAVLLVHEGGPATMNARKLRADMRFRRRLLEQTLGGPSATLFPPWVELDEIRSSLPPGSLFVDIVRFHPARISTSPGEPAWDTSHYVAWVIPPTGIITVVDLGEAAPIDAAIQTARQEIADGVRVARQLGEAEAEKKVRVVLTKLSDRVLKPFDAHLKGVKNFILSPDGDLWLVPWAALPITGDKYLVEAVTPRLVLSGRDLLKPTGFKGETSAPLVIADPSFDAAPVPAGPRLAGTEAKGRLSNFEATFVFGNAGKLLVRVSEGAIIGQGTWKQDGDLVTMETERSVYTGRIVGREIKGERRLKEKTNVPPDGFVAELAELGTTRVFAGTALKAGPLSATRKQGEFAAAQLKELTTVEANLLVEAKATESALKAAKRPKVLVVATHSFHLPPTVAKSDDPLERSGLLLAGSNKREEATAGQEDGVLTASEIVGLDLRGTRLVVLTGCDAAHAGDAVASLRQAFQMAGTPSVLAPLWPSTDAEATRLLNRFYTRLAGEEMASVALAEIQREAILVRRKANGAAHPYSWAAFTMTGR